MDRPIPGSLLVLLTTSCTRTTIGPGDTEVESTTPPFDDRDTTWTNGDDDGGGGEDGTGTDDGGTDDGGTDDGGTDDTSDTRSDYERCFEDLAGGDTTTVQGPDYDQFPLTVGSHCYGTNHQDISGIERVVFLGDSVTVGTPPTDATDWYRNVLADALVAKFGLEEPGWEWENVDLFSGVCYEQDSGDFSSCAEWGARADDLMRDDTQVEDCLPADQRDKTTLVIMTVGGNDLNSLTSDFMEGKMSHAELWAKTEEYMGLVRDAVEWIKTPGTFPNGVHVVFSNLYEFTDATGDVTSCPVAGLAGYTEAVTDPKLAEMVVWSMEEYMHIATDTGSDMLFLLETFCGHGYNKDDPDGRCYRGEGSELWFDLTCIHPNETGHAKMAEMFMAVVNE